jgi:hypothetical protein
VKFNLKSEKNPFQSFSDPKIQSLAQKKLKHLKNVKNPYLGKK